VKTTEEIYAICQEANVAKNCIGIIAWMHTFSPAKMWIAGLKILQKPMLHLHTQFNRDTIARLVRWFTDPQIGAVAGNAKVGNRINMVTRWQALEYIVAQNIFQPRTP